MLDGKNILDVGAGAGGKDVYYLSRGASHVTAVDINDAYRDEAVRFAEAHGVSDRFDYIVCDGASMPLESSMFDAAVMNDSMEHVHEPTSVLNEIARTLKPRGKLYINFPPYSHPYGAHLSDVISIPWVHLFFDENTLIEAYKKLTELLPDGNERVRLRISEDENGHEYFSYINKMTIKRFNDICKSTDRLKRIYYKEIPLRSYLLPLAKLPIIKEAFTRRIVAVFEKN